MSHVRIELKTYTCLKDRNSLLTNSANCLVSLFVGDMHKINRPSLLSPRL